MNLDANFITNLNKNFIILNSAVGADTPDDIATSLIGSDLIDAINDNFGLTYTQAPVSTSDIYLGMRGSQFLSYINSNFNAKADYLESTKPEVKTLIEISDDIIAIYDPFDSATVTKDGSDVVSEIKDKLLSGNDLSTGSCGWDSVRGLTFNGVDQHLESDVWYDQEQPFMAYMVFRQRAWTEDAYMFCGVSGDGFLVQSGGIAGNILRVNAGEQSTPNNNLGIDRWGIIRVLFNGADSFFKIDDSVEINWPDTSTFEGDLGTDIMRGFILGGGSLAGHFSNIDVMQVILCKAAQSAANESVINEMLKTDYLADYRFDKGKVVFGWDGDVMSYIKTGHDILTANGIKSTMYMCTHGGGGTDDAAMWLIVADMFSDGAEIQMHGYDHAQFQNLDEAELNANISAMIANIEDEGYDTPDHLAYPYGYNDALARQVTSEYCVTGRGVREVQLMGTTTAKFDLPGFTLGGYTNSGEGLQQILDQVDYAIANKTACIIYCHGVDEITGGANAAGLTALAEYISAASVAGTIDIINHSELAALLD